MQMSHAHLQCPSQLKLFWFSVIFPPHFSLQVYSGKLMSDWVFSGTTTVSTFLCITVFFSSLVLDRVANHTISHPAVNLWSNMHHSYMVRKESNTNLTRWAAVWQIIFIYLEKPTDSDCIELSRFALATLPPSCLLLAIITYDLFVSSQIACSLGWRFCL